MVEPEILPEISIIVAPDMFTSEARKAIYKAMLELYDEHRPIDSISLADKLKSNGMLSMIGGVAGLMALCDATPTASNATDHAGIIRRDFYYRKIIDKSSEIQSHARKSDAHLPETISEASQLFHEYTTMARPIDVGLKSVLAIAKQRAHTGDDLIPFGHRRMDGWMGGALKREVTIIAGRTANLKTSFYADRVDHWCLDLGLRAMIASLEIPADMFMRKVICKHGRINSDYLKRCVLRKDELEKFIGVCDDLQEKLEGRLCVLDYTKGVADPAQLERAARLFKPDVLVVDYIQLSKLTHPRYRRIEIGDNVKALKRLSIEMNFALVIISQISRAAMTQSAKGPPLPRLQDLKESGELEEMGCDVLLLYYPYTVTGDLTDSNKLRVELAKSKYGPRGVCWLHFDPAFCELKDLGENYESTLRGGQT